MLAFDIDLGTGRHICKYCMKGKALIKIWASCWHREYYSPCQHEAQIHVSQLADEQLKQFWECFGVNGAGLNYGGRSSWVFGGTAENTLDTCNRT